MGAREQHARLRLLRPQHSHSQGRWLRNLSRSGRSDATHVESSVPTHGVVFELPSLSRKLSSPTGRGFHDGLAASDPAEGTWPPASQTIQRRSGFEVDELLDLSQVITGASKAGK